MNNPQKKYYLVGIGGIGISGLTKLLLEQGNMVTGSDLDDTFITKDLTSKGAIIFKGHDSSHLQSDTDVLIYSDAIPESNPERVKAKEFGLKQISYYEYVGEMTKKMTSIAVAGNKGKTTTTAMVGLIMEAAGMDPSVLVGSYVTQWKSNSRFGKSQYFVTEACEFKDHFLKLHPTFSIITNIEPDHLDYFVTFEREIESFKSFITKHPHNGYVIMNADDKVSAQLIKTTKNSITIGINNPADLTASNIEYHAGQVKFDIEFNKENLGTWTMQIPGLFNIYNALGAMAMCLKLGISADIIKTTLQDFHGTWRRFEILGKYNGATVISDYAHHPSAVAATLKAAKDFFPGQRVVVAFHPHHHHRTKSLFHEFVESFDSADVVILNEIYRVAGRDEIENDEISSQDLVDAICKRDQTLGKKRPVQYGKDFEQTRLLIEKEIQENDILIVMGAGDLYKVAESLVS